VKTTLVAIVLAAARLTGGRRIDVGAAGACEAAGVQDKLINPGLLG
jgi:hypothetical protein